LTFRRDFSRELVLEIEKCVNDGLNREDIIKKLEEDIKNV
jgi:hypothetical protein